MNPGLIVLLLVIGGGLLSMILRDLRAARDRRWWR